MSDYNAIMTSTSFVIAPPPVSFVPADFDPSNWDQIAPLLTQLIDRPLDSVDDVQAWLLDMAEFDAILGEYGARCSIDHSCHTDDADIEARYMHLVENIHPKMQPELFKLQKKLVDCPHAAQLPTIDLKFNILLRQYHADIALFRDENIPLQTQVTKTATEYGKLCGKMLVEFQGETLTLQQLARYYEETDRDIRESAWRLSTDRRLQDRDAIDAIYDKLLHLRQQIADNTGMGSYRDYIWQSQKRFDYTPDDCMAFGDAIAKHCVPRVRALDIARRDKLGIDTLRPWDAAVDPLGRSPLRPFDAKQVDDLVKKTHEIFSHISPKLADMYATLEFGRNLDLDSRQGKRPGGFQSSLQWSRQPFIFMNAAGLQSDVDTMLHEAGHAFHFMAATDEPIVDLRQPGLEFCEVASMSMELLGMDHYDVFYNNNNDATSNDGKIAAGRAKRHQLEGIIRILPWIATIDSFQHALYTQPAADINPQKRTAIWRTMLDRYYSNVVDHTGIESARDAMWQRQLHLIHYPFYYIEYGIAQLGALQVWLNYRNDPQQALAALLDAFSAGGTKTLPELFELAGIRFDFTETTIEPLIVAIESELADLPD